jgi:hypothetical protein
MGFSAAPSMGTSGWLAVVNAGLIVMLSSLCSIFNSKCFHQLLVDVSSINCSLSEFLLEKEKCIITTRVEGQQIHQNMQPLLAIHH